MNINKIIIRLTKFNIQKKNILIKTKSYILLLIFHFRIWLISSYSCAFKHYALIT